MDNIYLILEENSNLINVKSHAIIKKFYHLQKLHILNFNNIKNFLIENKYNSIKIFFYIYIDWSFGIKLLDFIKNDYKKNKPDIYIFTDDYWDTGSNYIYLNSIFDTKNYYKVICQAPNIDILFDSIKSKKYIYKKDLIYNQNIKNIIFNSFWCCYDNSFIEENNNIINKILISGRTWQKTYNERYLLSKINGTLILDYNDGDNISINFDNLQNYYQQNTNNYSIELNKYVACFSSSIYNKHAILLKTYEILATGSLLVMPLKEEMYINNIGLINKKNCWLIDFNKNLQQQVDEILNPNNRYLIDVIRRNGHKYAKEHLNSNIKFNNIISLTMDIPILVDKVVNNEWFLFKQHFIKKKNTFICKTNTFLKKNTKNSSNNIIKQNIIKNQIIYCKNIIDFDIKYYKIII